MEPQQKQHRAGVVTAVVSLVALCIFWAVYFAYRHPTKPPNTTRTLSTKELADELNTIKEPAGAKKLSPAPIPNDDPNKHEVGALYSANSECNTIAEHYAEHYKEEFAHHGFVNRPLRSDANKQLESSAFFCGHGMSAQFGCMSQPEGRFYMIHLSSPDDTCAD